jgi:hypothetical protein
MADRERQHSRTVPHTSACVPARFFVTQMYIQRTLHDGVLMCKPGCPIFPTDVSGLMYMSRTNPLHILTPFVERSDMVASQIN